MVVDADRLRDELEASNENDGHMFKMRRDPRVTPWGASCAATPWTSCPSCSTSSSATCPWSARAPGAGGGRQVQPGGDAPAARQAGPDRGCGG
ncbi:hypothetical protein LT493_12295 [Streptomyces tricolor]|nr:hypothetical protein [Streptomyces tricolor]